MNSRVREDEKHEMIIRKLLKNSENKRCINCGSLGPQYVCTNFSIFVCTYCSGVHREFTHRIKSISMAKFTPGEVANLQVGGNGRARDIYFKELDPVRNPLPDSSDPDKLRNFIKHVYVERKFTGERPAPTNSQQGDTDDTRRTDSRNDRKPDFQSPSREDINNDRRSDDRFNDRARKSDVGGHYNEKRSPGRFEPDRPPRRSYDDRDGRRDEKASHEGSRDRAKPPSRPFAFRNSEDDAPPIRSVKEILGDDVPSLRVDTTSRSIPGSIPAPAGLQKDGRSQSLNHLGNGESAAAAPAVKRVSSESMISLIDFSADPEPVVLTAPVPDPFAPAPITKPSSDPFALGPFAKPASHPFAPVSTPASQPVVDLFASSSGNAPFADPFGPAVTSTPVTDPFASTTTAKQVDPFGFAGQRANGPSGNASWATFDFNSNPAPPEGYPGPFGTNAATNGPANQFSAGGTAWGTSTSSADNTWSAFGLQTAVSSTPAPAPAPGLLPQQPNIFTTSAAPTTSKPSMGTVESGFPPQPTTASGRLEAPTSMSGRVRREIPQDFFAQPSVFGLQDPSFSMGGGQHGPPQFSHGGQQAVPQLSRTRNPFDDDAPPAPFSMGSLQAALPQVVDPSAGAASQWGHSMPQYLHNMAPGGFGYGNQLSANMIQQNGTPGGFAPTQGFNQGAVYGGPPFYSQIAGSNPFG